METLHLDNCEIASANTKTPQANPNNYSYARITGDPLLMDYPVFEEAEFGLGPSNRSPQDSLGDRKSVV